MAWRLAKSLETLRNQVNAAYPNRSKRSDGTIGDYMHSLTASDHNPNINGVVCALDLTHDPANGFDAHALAEHLRKNRHPNLRYVISNARIAGWWTNWEWAPSSGHTQHIHVSVGNHGVGDGQTTSNYDSTQAWNINAKGGIVLEEQPPVFIASYYLAQNKDVAKQQNTQAYAKEHWLKHGIKEGRPSAPNFHVKEYLANYADLRKAYGDKGYASAVKHYYRNGIKEGRSGRTVSIDGQAVALRKSLAEVQKALENEKAKPPKEVVKEVEKIVEKEVFVDRPVGEEEAVRGFFDKLLDLIFRR